MKRGKGDFSFCTLIVIVWLFTFSSCGANEGILKSGKENPDTSGRAPRQQTFEQDLEDVRTGDFLYIYVLRRKDGGEIDAEDRSVIKLNTDGANRRVSADNGKAFIIGTNNAVPPENIAAIYERLAVENYSPAPQTNTTANSNDAK